MMSGMPSFASTAEREQAESYFAELLSYRRASVALAAIGITMRRSCRGPAA